MSHGENSGEYKNHDWGLKRCVYELPLKVLDRILQKTTPSSSLDLFSSADNGVSRSSSWSPQ